MNSFLDRQTINNLEVDNLVYSKQMYHPQKKIFADFVSTILGSPISYHSSMDSWFFKITPEFEESVIINKTKQYAFDYSEFVKSKKNSSGKLRREKCLPSSMELPQIPIYNELGGRNIF